MRDLHTCISLASVTRSTHSLAGLQGTCTCCIIHSHVYLVSILTHCWTYHSLFFDFQVLTLLSEKYSLFSCVNLHYPTTRLHSYFSIICTCTMGCKRSLTSHHTCTYVLVTEKSADMERTLKLHVRFYNRISRS